MIAGAIIALAAWGIVLAWLIATLARIVRREHHDRQVSNRRQAELLASAEREHRERLRRQQRQIDARDALYELPSASHRGGRTR